MSQMVFMMVQMHSWYCGMKKNHVYQGSKMAFWAQVPMAKAAARGRRCRKVETEEIHTGGMHSRQLH